MGVAPIDTSVFSTPAQPPTPSAAPLHLLQTKVSCSVPPLSFSESMLTISDEQLRPEVFMKSLFDVMRKRGQPITGTPYIEGKEVDLYQLYQAVMLNGGSEVVSFTCFPSLAFPDDAASVQTNTQQSWNHIAKQLSWDVDVSTPSTTLSTSNETISLSRQLAELYQQLLYPFEMVWEKALSKQQSQLREREAALANSAAMGRPGGPPSNGAGPSGVRGAGIGAGWPQNQGGLNGNVLGVGGVGGASGTAMSPQQYMSLGLSPAPQGSDINRRSSPQMQQLAQAQGLPPPPRPNSASSQNQAGPLPPPNGNLAPNGTPTTLRAGTIQPSPEQMNEARAIIDELRKTVEMTRRESLFPTLLDSYADTFVLSETEIGRCSRTRQGALDVDDSRAHAARSQGLRDTADVRRYEQSPRICPSIVTPRSFFLRHHRR